MKNKIIILTFLMVFGTVRSFSSSVANASTDAGQTAGAPLRSAAKLKTVTDSDSDEEKTAESPSYDSAQLTTRTFARLKCGCEAFEMIERDDRFSGVMHLPLKQILEDSELRKNELFDLYYKMILKDIPEIALEIENHIRMQFPDKKKFEMFIREKVSLNGIYNGWKKVINAVEGGVPLVSFETFGDED